jgi:MATE family multidrug resistance protein
MAGQFGAAALAAHMIGLSVASCAFMVPLALSQAATVRVAEAAGAGRPAAARRAGFCAIGMSLCVMGAAAVLLTCAPQLIVRAYLGQATPDADATARIAAQLLGVAAMFQLADGTQVAAAGALRGLQDVRLPMLLATAGYWGGGFWVGWFLAFPCHLGVLGLWWGLFTGLCLVAVCLAARFAVRSGDGHGNRSA